MSADGLTRANRRSGAVSNTTPTHRATCSASAKLLSASGADAASESVATLRWHPHGDSAVRSTPPVTERAAARLQHEGFESAAPRAKGPYREAKVVFSGLDSVKPPPKPDGEEDDGWGSDDSSPKPSPPPDAPPAGEAPDPVKKPVFGRRNKRYSQRL